MTDDGDGFGVGDADGEPQVAVSRLLLCTGETPQALNSGVLLETRGSTGQGTRAARGRLEDLFGVGTRRTGPSRDVLGDGDMFVSSRTARKGDPSSCTLASTAAVGAAVPRSPWQVERACGTASAAVSTSRVSCGGRVGVSPLNSSLGSAKGKHDWSQGTRRGGPWMDSCRTRRPWELSRPLVSARSRADWSSWAGPVGVGGSGEAVPLLLGGGMGKEASCSCCPRASRARSRP
mmetsp:Transcript_28235/g.82605  ORF Transcript_28235/g.82605 Transcript_28235/m.82605 type:complete len:234 (+) Transcript_28235:505-1206(+)